MGCADCDTAVFVTIMIQLQQKSMITCYFNKDIGLLTVSLYIRSNWHLQIRLIAKVPKHCVSNNIFLQEHV